MNLFKDDAEKVFNVETICSKEMTDAQSMWAMIIKGTPYWLSENTRSINFAKYICQYTAKKSCLDVAVSVEGSDRADFIASAINAMVGKTLRDKVEDACGLGGIMLKPNGNKNPKNSIDYVLPWNFSVTEQSTNGDVLGAIFFDRITKGKDYYSRLEYHHFVSGQTEDGEEGRFYVIENRAFHSKDEKVLGNLVGLDVIPEWKDLVPSVTISNVEKPLFAYLKMPSNNTIDYKSPEGVAIFSNCIEELRDLDIAWSRKGDEVDDSQHITFIDESTLTKQGKNGRESRVSLPRFVKGIKMGVDSTSTIDEHIATLLTDQRIADINSILSMISTKAGFSQGQFILDRKTGTITATQIESDDSETVETIMDLRKSIKEAIKDLVYALNKYCDLVYMLPDGYVNVLDENVPEEDIFYFKDLISTFEQDRQRAYQLMMQGIYSKKKYLMEYEGFKEEEAIQMLMEAKSENAEKEESLFNEE